MGDWTVPRAAVIPTHNRPAELARCVEAIAAQVDQLVVVDNASNPPARTADIAEALMRGGGPHCRMLVLRDEEQPPNLSRLWNLGLGYAQWCLPFNLLHDQMEVIHSTSPYDVAVLNDDATVPPDWFDRVAGPMRDLGADAASHGEFLGPEWGNVMFGPSAPMSVTTRLAGWAFILRGEWEGARFDERLRWWCADDLVSLRAREAGGLVLIGGLKVPNEHADHSTVGALAEQAGRDHQTFIDITGRSPW